jgi:hypothetical protein
MSGQEDIEKIIKKDANAITNKTVARIFQNVRIPEESGGWPATVSLFISDFAFQSFPNEAR